jgi:hypothetical protein
VPDVSASADPLHPTPLYESGTQHETGTHPLAGWTVIGGTSDSAPEWAAALAIVAASPTCHALPRTRGGRDLGFAAPELYAVASDASSYAASFTDVTTGNNDSFDLGRGYSAGPGYNLVTGLGTPVLAGPSGQPGLAADLCAVAEGGAPSGPVVPVVTGVSPASGPLAGGSTVTISGSGFPAIPAGIKVGFGAVPARVISSSPTSIVVTAPRARVPRSTRAFAAATVVDVTVAVPAPGGSGELASLPDSAARYAYLAEAPPGGAVPTVTGLVPGGGVPAGGTAVTIYGDGFTAGGGVTAVSFGGVTAAFKVVDDTELVATAPAQSSSTSCATGAGFEPSVLCQVAVVVRDAAGSSPRSRILPPLVGAIRYDAAGLVKTPRGVESAEAIGEYEYAPVPVITSVSPDPVNFASTAPVTVHGSGFNLPGLEWVNFGPASSTTSQQVKFTEVTPTEIQVVPAPAPQAPGAAPVPLRGGVSVQMLSGLSNAVPFSYGATSGASA